MSENIPDDILSAAKRAAYSVEGTPWEVACITSSVGVDIIAKAILAERERCLPSLQPIATAPHLERVMVCGWQPPSKRVIGYWWWHEDAVSDGKAIEDPEATHWFPIMLPDFGGALEEDV